MKKISDILLGIFAVGMILSLFAGSLSALGYVVALIIGGDTASALCTFVFKSYLPWVIKGTSVLTGFGLLGMYLSGQKALNIKVENTLEKK